MKAMYATEQDCNKLYVLCFSAQHSMSSLQRKGWNESMLSMDMIAEKLSQVPRCLQLSLTIETRS